LGILSNYNLVAALLPDTNDLIVSVLNKDNNMENIIVPNIPIQQPFRLTMIVMEQALEVYINGKLARNCELSSMPKMNEGDLYINLDGGFDGLLSQFRYHKKALTEEDVRRLYSVSHIADPRVLMANLSVSEYIPSCRLGSDTTSPNAVSEPTSGSTV
jgi:hypothetical protein